MTSWEPEYVCECSVKMVHETQISDMYSCLLGYARKGEQIAYLEV